MISSIPHILEDDEHAIQLFVRNMGEFDAAFCKKMLSGKDFTIRLEVRGNRGKLIHCRVSEDGFDRMDS